MLDVEMPAVEVPVLEVPVARTPMPKVLVFMISRSLISSNCAPTPMRSLFMFRSMLVCLATLFMVVAGDHVLGV